VDGVCCDGTCAGDCNVCAAALGASADGTCTNAAGYAGNSSCAPYLCTAASPTCPGTCAGDGDCDGNSYCDGTNSCVARKAQGDACSYAADCRGGTTCNVCATGLDNCVDGYCCDTTCDGTCQACDVSGAEGTCTDVPTGTQDPGTCDAATFCCQSDQSCDTTGCP